jgi:copper transport protein
MGEKSLILCQSAALFGSVLLVGGLFVQEVLFLGKPVPSGLLKGLWGGLLLILAAGSGMVYGTVGMMMGEVSLADAMSFLRDTHPGQMLALRGLLGLVLTLLFYIPSNLIRRVLTVAVTVGFVGSFSSVSHAGLVAGPLSKLADGLHFLAACAWAGLLWYFAWLGPGLFQRSEDPEGLVDRLSGSALGCVILLGASGLYSAWIHLTGWSSLWTSDWGKVLLAKLAFFTLALAMAGYNRWRLVPFQGNSDMGLKLCRMVLFESLVLVVIFGFTAVLTRTDPPDAATSEDAFYWDLCGSSGLTYARPERLTGSAIAKVDAE